MAEETISIGGKDFDVACQPGEEHFLQAAARMLDTEARTLLSQIGRLPADKMLLMSGLMLADKTAGLEDKLRLAEEQVAAIKAENETLRNRPLPAASRIEVPVIPRDLTDSLAELAARAEAVAGQMEENLKTA
jgi:cell division protein ZapA